MKPILVIGKIAALQKYQKQGALARKILQTPY